MESQKGDTVILDVEESKEMFNWLMTRGLSLRESAWVICDLGTGDTLSIALIKAFKYREELKDKTSEDWGNPVTP